MAMRTHVCLATKPILFLLRSAALSLPPAPLQAPLPLQAARGPQSGPFPGLIPGLSYSTTTGSLLHRAEPQSLTACLPASLVNELLISALGRHRRSLLLSTPAFVKL